MTNFHIEVGAPEKRSLQGSFANDLSEAIEMAYPMESAAAQLVWCGRPLTLNYKYDVSVIIEDVIEMLEKCREGALRQIEVSFGSNTFNAVWKLDFRADALEVNAHWNCIVGGNETILNECPSVRIDRKHFAEQWMKLLRQVVSDIQLVGIRLGDSDLLSRAKFLLQEEPKNCSA